MDSITKLQYVLSLNGHATTLFSPLNGLRQVDPLSLYIFIFCVNTLLVTIQQETLQKSISGFWFKTEGFQYSQFMFADDIIFLNNVHDKEMQS